MTVHASGKIQVTMNPALPATCVVCHKSANGDTKFLDFQADVDYYGAIVVCEDCAKEMLDVLEFVPVAERNNLIETNEVLEGAYLAVRAENEQLRNTFDSILVIRPDLSASYSSNGELDNQEFESAIGSGESEN